MIQIFALIKKKKNHTKKVTHLRKKQCPPQPCLNNVSLSPATHLFCLTELLCKPFPRVYNNEEEKAASASELTKEDENVKIVPTVYQKTYKKLECIYI